MNTKLKRDSLTSDLHAVEQLLAQRTRETDPVGWFQFSGRRDQLTQEIALLGDQVDTSASVAVFFGGRPVLGSRGVFADFGGKALEQFQNLISIQHAALEGPVGARGPIPQRDKAQLIIADVARGSFGFVLEEASPGNQLVDSSTKLAVNRVADLITRVSSADVEAFEAAAEAVDDRVLGALRSFITLVDQEGATLRIVEDDRDFTLQRDAIERAHDRISVLEIEDRQRTVTGTFYLLPEARRFELHAIDGTGTYRGTVAPEAMQGLIDDNGNALPGIIRENWTVVLSVREIRSPHREPRLSYRLLAIGEPEGEQRRVLA